MELLLKRIAKRETYTIGRLYVDGEKFCDTLEDKDRGLVSTMPLAKLRSMKIKSQTAIPTGRYQISLDIVSPKYSRVKFYADVCKGKVPRLLNVPAFDGILIHAGNTAKDTAGCLLTGINSVVGQVLNSKETWKRLYLLMYNRHVKNPREQFWITIK